MNIILWIVFGAIIGWISSILMNSNDTNDIAKSIVICTIAALGGGWFANRTYGDEMSIFNVYALLVAISITIVIAWLWHYRKTV